MCFAPYVRLVRVIGYMRDRKNAVTTLPPRWARTTIAAKRVGKNKLRHRSVVARVRFFPGNGSGNEKAMERSKRTITADDASPETHLTGTPTPTRAA